MDIHAMLRKTTLFDDFYKEVQSWYELPAHSLSEMRARDSKKARGDIFEEFCVLYLKHVRGFEKVWLLSDIPDDILELLKLKRRDMGIDIVVFTGGEYYAVQCKYKKRTPLKKNVLSWTALSTFYAMCLRTGPWKKYIVMTTCDYTRHQGKKTSADESICLKQFQNITTEEWRKMSCLDSFAPESFAPGSLAPCWGFAPGSLAPCWGFAPAPSPLTEEELRAARLKYFSR
jgi:hypothetical protein